MQDKGHRVGVTVQLPLFLLIFRALRTVVATFVALIPRTAGLGGMLLLSMLLFSSVGVQFFGGAVFRDAPLLNGTDFAELGYWPNNFNDNIAGIVVLFELLGTPGAPFGRTSTASTDNAISCARLAQS